MESKGVFGKLFDLSFSEFVTTRVIKVLYVIGIVISGLYAIAFISMGFNEGTGIGILFLILSPIIFLLGVLVSRIYMELLIVIFRIAEGVSEISAKLGPGKTTDVQ